jgi:predicted RNase H-like nuclease (RuvC/YqgF family)
MSEAMIALVIAALGGGTLTALISALANRRKTRADTAKTNADATKIITDATKEILGDYRKRNDELEEDLASLRQNLRELQEELRETRRELKETKQQYEQEQALQDVQIENTNAEILKLRLINEILTGQMKERGIVPLIDPRRFDNITVQELQDIVSSLRSIERRREEARRGGTDD